LIIEGAGYYQERGKPARFIRKGDVIKRAPGVEHWRGATPNSGFAYPAVTPLKKDRQTRSLGFDLCSARSSGIRAC
jgi:quercetin dioxygenase-like cupin family protein